jgi:TonB family protein
MRDDFLVRELIGAAVRPVMAWQGAGERLKKAGTLKFGKTSLSCVTTVPDSVSRPGGGSGTLCTDPQIDDVRAVLEQDRNWVVLRNSIGKFHDTYVALGLQFSLLGQGAITGTVTALQNFDPATSEVKLPPPASEAAAPGGGAGHVPAQVMAGRRIHFAAPEYPAGAELTSLSGAVLLDAVIGKDGAIQTLTPIASTDAMFTDAAMKAVQQWRYSPYLLNGVPTKVETPIMVNFGSYQR